jgi:hemoglobin
VLNHPFSHPGHPQHLERLASSWAEVLGGPARFSLECGDQSEMISIHAGMQADDDLAERFINCFLQAIDDAGLSDDAEFRTALRSYIEWAVRDVHTYSPRGSVVPTAMSVPRWNWDGLEGPDDGA